MWKAALFDLDGLLIDSEPLWQEAEMEVFATVGVPLTREHCLKTQGMRIDQVVAFWFQLYPWSGVSQAEVSERVVERLLELIRERGRPLPGALAAIDLFRGAGVPVAIASSSSRRIIQTVVDKFCIGERITLFHSAEHEEFGKPHPAVYQTTCKLLKVNPRECGALEDSVNGVLSAKGAGLKVIAVPDPHVPRERYTEADVILDSLVELRLADIEL